MTPNSPLSQEQFTKPSIVTVHDEGVVVQELQTGAQQHLELVALFRLIFPVTGFRCIFPVVPRRWSFPALMRRSPNRRH
jgi:hypothetical protein